MLIIKNLPWNLDPLVLVLNHVNVRDLEEEKDVILPEKEAILTTEIEILNAIIATSLVI